MKKENQKPVTRQMAQAQYEKSRYNLLLMLIFTVINIFLMVCGSETMLLFSATVPYMAACFGAWEESAAFLGFYATISATSIVAYFICWIFSKKHAGWMIAALVLFILDTLAMIGLYLLAEEVSGVLDVLMHAWILYYLIIGVKYGFLMRKLPEEEPVLEETTEEN